MADMPNVFQPPPEAPVFEPTSEEFQDPLSFIARIRPQVEKVGICKIKPPPEWQPPFVVDVDTFKFTPRMQKINELEATTRVKLNFLDKLLKFWELQGTSIKIPTVDRKLLDFHKLHKAPNPTVLYEDLLLATHISNFPTVQNDGGYALVTQQRKWNRVAFSMGLSEPSSGKCTTGSVLKGHYEKYLYPFDLFEAGITVDQNAIKEELKREAEAVRSADIIRSADTVSLSVTPTSSPSLEPVQTASSDVTADASVSNAATTPTINSTINNATTPMSANGSSGDNTNSSVIRGSRKRKEDKFLKTYGSTKSPKKDLLKAEPDIDYTANSELRKLQFFGAGPKTALPLQLSKSSTLLASASAAGSASVTTPPIPSVDTSTDTAAITLNDHVPVVPLSGVKDMAPPQPPLNTGDEMAAKDDVTDGTALEGNRSSANTEHKRQTETAGEPARKWKMRDRSANWRSSYLEDAICVQCEMNNNDRQVLVCDACNDAYHMYCLVPPLVDMPKGDWRCPKCVAKECNRPKAAYGFEQAKRQFTLQEFGEMADQFKADYFQMPAHMVPGNVVEREFWRLTQCLEEDVTVHYGADIHALTMGSGFPTRDTKQLDAVDQKYVESLWNLNKLPVSDRSVLRYVSGDVSGMKVPWCYVGMCFSSFCWHIEDHWSYSVNYMHWGEDKTWYGVPSSHAEELERVMKNRAPELFEQSPDLLHHITTIMNPNLLMSQGIPIVRTDQSAGEFIVTFPRAYHAGFNQGYNFAEAVNFCPTDWLPFGRGCINNYKLVKRQCVFSHEELVFKMAADPDSLDLELTIQTHSELASIIEAERQQRTRLLKLGVRKAEQEAFELIPDDERQCCYCKTTCFLSAVYCPCKPNSIVCLEHVLELCRCSITEKVLRYRYTLDEMPAMMRILAKRVDSYELWSQRVKGILAATSSTSTTPSTSITPTTFTTPTTSTAETEEVEGVQTTVRQPDLAEVTALIKEARDHKYPDTGVLACLVRCQVEAEKCAAVASQLIASSLFKLPLHVPSQPLRNNSSLLNSSHNTNGTGKVADNERGRYKGQKISMYELEQFYAKMKSLPCSISETGQVKDFMDKVREFQAEAELCVSGDIPSTERVDRLYQFGSLLRIELPEVAKLKFVLEQALWLDKVNSVLYPHLSSTSSDTSYQDSSKLASLDSLKQLIEESKALAPNQSLDKVLSEVEQVVSIGEKWDEKAHVHLQARPRSTIGTLEGIVSEAEKVVDSYRVAVELPNVTRVKQAVIKANDWINEVEVLSSGEHYPYLEQLEQIVTRGREIPVRLDLLPQVESQVAAAKSWKERTARAFLKKNSPCSLLEVLSPRSQTSFQQHMSRRRKKKDSSLTLAKSPVGGETPVSETCMDTGESHNQIQRYNSDPAEMVLSFKVAETEELELMRNLRSKNADKHRQSDVYISNSNGSYSPGSVSSRHDVKYCLCGKVAAGVMFQCQLCRDWYHASCVPMFKSSLLKSKSVGGSAVAAMSLQQSAAKETKFLCPFCLRSRRPRLETILSLLVALQKLPVRLLEGEALQCLTERAMAWQDRARQLLSTDELSSALSKLSLINQKLIERAAREKTEKIINAELLKVGRHQHVSALSFADDVKAEPGDSIGDSTNAVSAVSTTAATDVRAAASAVDVSEHAYSTVSKTSSGLTSGFHVTADSKGRALLPESLLTSAVGLPRHSKETSSRKQSRKSPLVPRTGSVMAGAGDAVATGSVGLGDSVYGSTLDSCALDDVSGGGCGDVVLDLPGLCQAQLDELMMEGDMLEVALDETEHIWKILFYGCRGGIGCSDPATATVLVFTEDKNVEYSKRFSSGKKERKRKRQADAAALDAVDDDELIQTNNFSSPHAGTAVKDHNAPKAVTKYNKRMSSSKGTTKDAKLVLKKHMSDKTTNSQLPVGQHKTKKKKKKSSTAVSSEKVKSTGSVMAAAGASNVDNADDDEDCSATNCLKPSGDEVDWVQCDKCELWFHLTCVGLAKGDLSDEDDFVCKSCCASNSSKATRSDSPINPISLTSAAAVSGHVPTEVDDSKSAGAASALLTKETAENNETPGAGDNYSCESEIISVVSTPIPSASQSPSS